MAGPKVAARQIGEAIELLIAVLDNLHGDPDLEDGDEDVCAAHDDDPAFEGKDGLPGDYDDTEEDLARRTA